MSDLFDLIKDQLTYIDEMTTIVSDYLKNALQVGTALNLPPDTYRHPSFSPTLDEIQSPKSSYPVTESTLYIDSPVVVEAAIGISPPIQSGVNLSGEINQQPIIQTRIIQ